MKLSTSLGRRGAMGTRARGRWGLDFARSRVAVSGAGCARALDGANEARAGVVARARCGARARAMVDGIKTRRSRARETRKRAGGRRARADGGVSVFRCRDDDARRLTKRCVARASERSCAQCSVRGGVWRGTSAREMAKVRPRVVETTRTRDGERLGFLEPQYARDATTRARACFHARNCRVIRRACDETDFGELFVRDKVMDAATSAQGLPGVAGKRCAHCNTQTTPLWRNGPDGPKTLCNACGVRDNRRHAKANRVAKPSTPKASKGGKSNGKGEGKKRGASSPSKGEKKDAKKQKPARDYFAPKANIHVPNFNVVSDYEALHAGGFRQPAKYLRQQAPDHQLHRFGPGTAASMYEATAADFKWLEHMNADEPLEGKGSEVCTTTPNANYMRPEHLEKLFDVFEETSWAASAMPTQEQAAQTVLGNIFNSANTAEGKLEDVLHWASNAQLGDGQLVNLKAEAENWNPFDLNDERSNQSSSETAAAPLTPSGSVQFLQKRASHSDGVPSENGDDNSSTQSADDLIERQYATNTVRQPSENVKSSDLGTRAHVGMTRRGGKSMFIARGARVPRPPTGGKSELKNAVKIVNQINDKIFKINKKAPSLAVFCKIYRYWLNMRWKNGGKPLLSRFDPVPPLRLRERPELATESEQLAYLFCFNLQAVSRQQKERALRAEQAEAQRKRRRRPCFNPAATKRRRRVQAAMDDAVSLPLTITFDPLDELLAHGWDVVQYDPSTCVVPKKKKIISESTKERAIKKEEPVKKSGANRPAPDALASPPRRSVEKTEFDVAQIVVPNESVLPQSDPHLKSPMGAAAAKAGALVKNFVSSVGCALGYGGNGKKCLLVNGSVGGHLSAPTTPTRRSTRVKTSDWNATF